VADYKFTRIRLKEVPPPGAKGFLTLFGGVRCDERWGRGGEERAGPPRAANGSWDHSAKCRGYLQHSFLTQASDFFLKVRANAAPTLSTIFAGLRPAVEDW